MNFSTIGALVLNGAPALRARAIGRADPLRTTTRRIGVDPRRSTAQRIGPSGFRSTSMRLGVDPRRSTSQRIDLS
jgi:hypothetical protein